MTMQRWHYLLQFVINPIIYLWVTPCSAGGRVRRHLRHHLSSLSQSIYGLLPVRSAAASAASFVIAVTIYLWVTPCSLMTTRWRHLRHHLSSLSQSIFGAARFVSIARRRLSRRTLILPSFLVPPFRFLP
jgi:hypothetical protein